MIRIILGIVFTIIAVVLLVVFLSMPDNETATNFMESLHCEPDESLLVRKGQYTFSTATRSGGQTMNYYCLNASEVERDVTGQVVLTLIAAFTVPFLIGLFLFMWGIFGIVRSKTRKFTQNILGGVPGLTGTNTAGFGVGSSPFGDQPAPGVSRVSSTTVTVDGKQTNLSSMPPETARILQQTLGKLGMSLDEIQEAAAQSTVSAGGNVQGTLVDRLQQLQDAYNRGLITSEEYERTKQAILDNMDD
jgi:uncharacterized membrane protein